MRRNSLLPGVCATLVCTLARAEPLPEARWLAPGADRVAALTQSPGECVSERNNTDTDYLSEIGRAAFSSPLLLGGQAARGGLACASCHIDGRSNPNFYLEGLSGAPGTADATSSIFSSVRDDGVFNPAPIPSLVGIGKHASFGTRAPQPSLHAFIGSAIVEEFQGTQVPPIVLDGLVAYIAGMDAAYCPKAPSALTPRRAMDDVRRTLAAARAASAKGDEAAADFLLVSAQAALGRINARFPGASSAALRDSLEALSGDISSARGLMKEPQSLVRALDEYSTRAKRIGKRLEKARGQSLYDPERLRAELGEE